ncbi:glycine/betaine ABC transporter permease, partial [Cronobacter sakazakii]
MQKASLTLRAIGALAGLAAVIALLVWGIGP